MTRPHVTLEDIHFTGMEYFDWLVTGLDMLAEDGAIDFTLRTTGTTAPFRLHPKIAPALRRVAPRVMAALSRGMHTIFTGSVTAGGKRTRFVFDGGDSPYAFQTDLLAETDLYFKAQCPSTLDPRGFPVAERAWMPYHPDVLRLADRIRPAMLGRPLSRTLNRRRNRRVLEQWLQRGAAAKDLDFLAYFGADQPIAHYGPEAVLMARFGADVEHPNLKRGLLVEGLRQRYGLAADARILKTDSAARRGPPLGDGKFNSLVGRAWHNINISGFRRSLPFRFCDAFLTRAAVPTDELAVRWYQPFEPDVEVIDLGKMGYERAEGVAWDRVWSVLDDLHREPEARRQERGRRIAERFAQYWHPRAFARYLVDSACAGW